MDVTPEEFVRRLVRNEPYMQPSDDCVASEIDYKWPTWFDERKFKLGQKFFRDNLFGQMATVLLGLITIITIPTILGVLVNSQRSSSSYTAYRRYISTFLHIYTWNTCDLKPGTKNWKSLLTVRLRHLKAGNSAREQAIGSISQRDISLTQFGFIAHALLYPDKLGIKAYDKESWEGFIHVYATVGNMIGLKDEYNMCLGSVEEATEICKILMESVYSPLLEFHVEPFEHMSYVIIDGVWSMMPLLDPKVFMYFTRMFAKVPGYVYYEEDLIDFRKKLKKGEIIKNIPPVLKEWHETMPRPDFKVEDFYRLQDVPEFKHFSLFERCKLHSIAFLIHIYSFGFFKVLINNFMFFMLLVVQYFPFLSFHRFGFKMSYINMFNESIKDNTKPKTNAEIVKMYRAEPWYIKFSSFFK